MTHLPITEFQETILVHHNIASAVSIVAAIKGIKPKEPADDGEMDKILDNVKNAYKYAFWKIHRHEHNILQEIIRSREVSLWDSKATQ